MTIMCVEDDELTRRAIAARLRRRGLDVIEATSGEQAIAVATDTPELGAVLLDVALVSTEWRRVAACANYYPICVWLW